ncbi:MAG: hypothetical protein RL701_3844 [Pseudomonadota bacterium]|jgi:uncharacterized protein (DUF924 family)
METPQSTLRSLETTSESVLSFWFGELDALGRAANAQRDRWWKRDAAFDQQIRLQFGALHTAALRGELRDWLTTPRSTLAYIIVLDQFSRNLFRDTSEQFAGDEKALTAAINGIELGLDRDRALRLEERTLFYLPLMHNEQLALQERCLQLYRDMSQELSGSARASMLNRIGYAERHRDIVRKFGRFPHRNQFLGRSSTPEECDFLELPESRF